MLLERFLEGLPQALGREALLGLGRQDCHDIELLGAALWGREADGREVRDAWGGVGAHALQLDGRYSRGRGGGREGGRALICMRCLSNCGVDLGRELGGIGRERTLRVRPK